MSSISKPDKAMAVSRALSGINSAKLQEKILNHRMLQKLDRFLSSAGAGGNCARPMRLPDPSPVLDKNRAPMGPEILSSTGAGSGERLLWHFQTPVLYWINFSLRSKA